MWCERLVVPIVGMKLTLQKQTQTTMNKKIFKGLSKTEDHTIVCENIDKVRPIWYKAIDMLIKQRMDSCLYQLKQNIEEAKMTLNEMFVIYKNGRYFNIPVYEAMEKYIETKQLTILIVQQAMRQWLHNRRTGDGWHICTYLKDNGTNEIDFERYITELFLVANPRF